MAFNFEAAETVDLDKVQAVASEMAGGGLVPLTPDQVLEREEWLAEHRARVEQERLADEQYRQEARRQQAEAAQREAAITAKAEREKAQSERQREIDRLTTQRSLTDLRLSAARRDAFERDVRTSHAQSVKQQYHQTLMGELDAMINAPRPVSDSFATRYRNNQRSGLYYVPEDSDE